MQELDDKYPD
jgi:hypothetical protein